LVTVLIGVIVWPWEPT
jgi:hypothetical protein